MELALRTWPSRLLARPWLAAFVPINAATSGFGVALPLLILISLHGRWVDVALAATLFNVAVIAASIGWGYLSDRYPKRRLFLMVNFAGFAVVYVLLSWTTSLPLLFGLYTVIGLLAPAGASASNLLILEAFPESERANAFASFQEMSMIGSLVGLLAGYFWLVAHRPLEPLLLVLAVLAAASVVLVWRGVKDPPRLLTPAHEARHPESLASRIRHHAGWHISFPFFPTLPRFSRDGVRRFRRWVGEEVHHELPLILAASLLFNLSANLFNISYTPYLYSVGIGAAAIFLVNVGNNVAQGVAFPFSGNLTSRLGADRIVHSSTYLRSLGYLAVAGFTFVPAMLGGNFGPNVLAYAVMGAAIAFYSTASSMILFRALTGRDAGSLLGLNSALGGLAAVGGAVLSGVLSVFGSFRLTFIVSAVALLVSLPLWSAAEVAYVRRRAGRASPDAAPARPSGVAPTQTD